MTNFKTGLGNNIKLLRKLRNITQEELSELIGIHPRQLSKIETGEHFPSCKTLERLCIALEITPQEGEIDSNDSKLTVLIQTKNFGNLKGVFTLTTSNSVDVLIICSENFPKNILQKSLMEESSAHAMNTNIDIEEVSPKKEENETHETKVNLSATNEMNPYLLLMAHAFIRNTILIDNNASLGL